MIEGQGVPAVEVIHKGISLKIQSLPCPNCGRLMDLRRSRFKNGWWYTCPDWPACSGSHGARPDGTPLGIPANQETKGWRIKAHDLFDRLYKCHSNKKQRRLARIRAYTWMQYAMGLSHEDAHIGRFDIAQCQRLMAILEAEGIRSYAERT